MLKDKTKFVDYGGSKAVLVPVEIRRDSAFPFEMTDNLEIDIVGNTLVVSKI